MMMRLFSSRRESITADLRARAAQFEQHYGRKPSQRELAHLAQASNFATRNAKHGALDAGQLHADWADKLARTLGMSLASVAPSVWHGATGRAVARQHRPHGPALTEPELARAAQKAVALAQQEKSTWTRADVIKWPAATRRCTTPTDSARTCSPPPWPIGPTGRRQPCSSGTWPWPPTPNCAATPASTTGRCGRPNPSPPPEPSARSSP
jgi:hypothetical protein